MDPKLERDHLCDIVEASLQGLLELERRITSEYVVPQFYLKLKLAFLKGEKADILKLGEELDPIKHHFKKHYIHIKELLGIKYKILAKEIDLDDFNYRVDLLGCSPHELWDGVTLFHLANGIDIIEEDARAFELYNRSYDALWEYGLKKMAVKALHHKTTVRNRMDPEGQYVAAYNTIYKKALKVGDPQTAAHACLSIAREYTAIGSYPKALQYAHKSVEMFEKELGSYLYYQALVQRGFILVALGRLAEAKMDYELSSLAGFADIRESRRVLEVEFKKRLTGHGHSSLFESTLEEKLQNKDQFIQLINFAEDEEKILSALLKGPCHYHDLLSSVCESKDDKAKKKLKKVLDLITRKLNNPLVVDGDVYHLKVRKI